MRDATVHTPAAVGAELLERLRVLLDRPVATLDEVRALADEVTAALRSTRGRIGRLARKDAAASTSPAPRPSAPAPKAEPVRTPAAPTETATAQTSPRPPARGIASRAVGAAASCRTVVQSAARAVGCAVKAVTRRARAILARGRRDAMVSAVELSTERQDTTAQAELIAPREPRPRADEDLSAIGDLNGAQVHGWACTECGGVFDAATKALRVPVGVSESTGEPVWACVGACARQASHREAAGEQLEMLS